MSVPFLPLGLRDFAPRGARCTNRAEVLRLLLADGLRPAFYGLTLGVAASIWAVRLIHSMLYGTEPLDPAIFAFVAASMMVMSGRGLPRPAMERVADRSRARVANGISECEETV